MAMQRPKQQAIAFLLGAVLVGGVVGFSADRVFRHEDVTIAERRKAMYDDLDMTPAQRASMDSLFDARNCQYDAIFRPIQPALDSLRLATREKMNVILTAEQRSKLDVRRKSDDDAHKNEERRRIQAACASR
jgi:Spy/CpxP family protein refolding chaperone